MIQAYADIPFVDHLHLPIHLAQIAFWKLGRGHTVDDYRERIKML